MNLNKNIILSEKKKKEYSWNAELVAFFRKNPSIAAEELLGVPLLDSQSYVLESSWNAGKIMWTCTRGWGKSFMIAVFAALKAILYPNMDIYIVSRSGQQAKETFEKIEDIAKGAIPSIDNPPDIFLGEVVKSRNSDGFKKSPEGYELELHNGSKIMTLNSRPDNVRGKRSRLLIYDESSFIDDELIKATMPFLSMDADFKMSTDDSFNTEAERRKFPNQLLFASSAGDDMSTHAEYYKLWSKKMIAGDLEYFCADIPVTEPINPTRNGAPMRTMMDVQQFRDMMESDPIRAQQEYYNKFNVDGGDEQIIKQAMIRRNESFVLPQLESENKDEHFAIAFDPAHQGDESIVTVMKVIKDPKIGYYGEIVYSINLFDGDANKNLRFTEQKDRLREIIYNFSTGAKLDYEGIGTIMIDAGAGGHGTSYASELLLPWTGPDGVKRYGLIDRTHDDFAKISGYSNNKNILRLIQPRAKKEMISQLITLMRSDLIKFNRLYSGENVLSIENKKGELEQITLTTDEKIVLRNLDILKTEATSIRKYGERYEVAKERKGKVGDDRFDTLVMLAHYLYTLRSDETTKKGKSKRNWEDYIMITGVNRDSGKKRR